MLGAMDVLLLGGTAFLGREIALRLLDRGHALACLARGRRPAPPGCRFIAADRDDPSALASVSCHSWDAVIDLSTQPLHAVRATQELTAEHWVYISSGSMYTDFSAPGLQERAPVHAPLASLRMRDMTEYGHAKVACENAYRHLDRPVTIIRPGLIGGDGDETGRSGYYPWRCAHPTGPDVLVPDRTQPTAILDARDLAVWIVQCLEERVAGVFNAAGPAVTLEDVYRHSQALAGADTEIRAVDDETLLAAGVQPWMGPRSLPLWLPDPGLRFAAVLDCGAAHSQGLRTRPPADTLAAALRYEERRSVPRQAGLTDSDERALRRVLRP